MRNLLFAIALFLIVPSLRAQQPETSGDSSITTPHTAPGAAPQQSPSQNPNAQDNLPASLRPGHSLDPADVDILTGKRDRDNEAARMASVPISVGAYGNYGSFNGMQGRFGRAFDIPLLPLTRITNPFFFSRIQPRGFARGGFLGRR